MGPGKGVFSVSSFYHSLIGERMASFPWQMIWYAGIPPKVSFFVWTATLNRILTLDNLIRCRQVLVNWCCMCRAAVESIGHLLLHCMVATELWSLILAIFKVQWVQPRSVTTALWSWQGGRVDKRRRKAWMYAPFCLMWSIWLERNKRTFQDVACSVVSLKSRLLSVLLSWVSGRVDPDLYSFLNSLDDLVT